MERREFLTTAISTAAVIASGAPAFAEEKKMESNLSLKGKVFELEHKLAPLPFAAGKLNGLSEKLIQSHWENNYGGSVKTLNSVRKNLSQALANKDTAPFIIGNLKKEHLLRSNSVVLHELYFGNLGGNGKCGSSLQKKIAESLGSFDAWESEFRKTGQSLGGGSGWVILAYNYHFQTLENYWSWDHMHTPTGSVPLLIMDMYEHSYQMDYGAAAAKYIDAFFQNINWETVEKRLEKVQGIKWS